MKSDAMFHSTERGLPLLRRGKVRDVYQPSEEHLLIIACDRISAFDHVLPTPIPDKGKILTQISNFWFTKSEHILKNHIVDPNPGPGWYPGIDWYYPELDGRTVLVRKTEPLVIEAIVRGYLSGSGWKEYQKAGTVCDIRLPGGLAESDELPEPIFTPSTKAESATTRTSPLRRPLPWWAAELAAKVRDTSVALYRFASDYARERGIIIADTKFEFGLLEDGELLLIDEMLTPDSSRFWPTESYQPGGPQASFDKQFVRDYLEDIKWDKEPPAPALPDEVVEKTRAKYLEAVKRLTT